MSFEFISAYLQGPSFIMLGLGIALGLGSFLVFARFTAKQIADSETEGLLKSRDFFLKLFDDSPVPHVMVDGETTIVLSNKAAQRLFQMNGQELSKFKFHQLHDADHFVQSRTVHDKFVRGVASTDVEMEIVRKDGVKRWVSLSAIPYRTIGGKGTGGSVSMFDITEQKAIDRVKTEFVSLASHQLRTPLTAMKWYGEMVLQSADPLTQKQRGYIEKIYEGNERMIELVNLLLSASRLELGSLTIDVEHVDPTKHVKQTLEEMALHIEEKKLHIIENYQGDATNYYTDKKLMQMIVQNLITNAIKYTGDGGEVRIFMEFTNDHLHFKVEDTGMGIAPEEQDKIFTKMFRAENARLKVTDGTGLGLYIVKEAVGALSGEIGFTSELNRGTMFTVTVPNGTHGDSK